MVKKIRPGEGSAPAPSLSEFDRIMLAFKATGGGIWDYDVTADLLDCNDRWYEIVGLDRVSTLIKCISDFEKFIHPEDVKEATSVDFERLDQMVKDDLRYHVDFRVIRPGGTIRWIRSVASLVENAPGGIRAVGCITDVTDLHEMPTEGQADPVATGGPADQGGKNPDLPVGEGALTSREKECLLWVSLGKTAWETAAIMNRSPRTVEFHLANAIKKLDASNKIHAVAIAIRRKLLQP